MQTIPISAIDDAWAEIMEAEETGSPELIDEFASEQPFIMTYLVSVEEEIEKLDDRGSIILYGMWAWLSFKYNGRSGTIVTAATIENARNANVKEMEELSAAGTTAHSKASIDLTHSYRQMPLLSAILTNVSEGAVESMHHLDDINGLILLEMKTVIDALEATP